MKPEASQFIQIITQIANSTISALPHPIGEESYTDAVSDAVYRCINNTESLTPEQHARSLELAKQGRERRKRQARRAEGKIRKHFSAAFDAWELALASSELVNQLLIQVLVRQMRSSDPQAESRLFDLGEELGGAALKTLVLAGMQARMTTYSSEILVLLRGGYHNGAHARLRTLYEMAVKSFFICNNEPLLDGYELAERYYVSARLEALDPLQLDSYDMKVLEEARKRWGDSFFGGDNNWAEPGLGIPRRRRITFRDIEDAIEGSQLRYIYRASNAAVHAGSMQVVTAMNMEHGPIFGMRGSVNTQEVAYIGATCIEMLKMGTTEILKRVARSASEWDILLESAAFTWHTTMARDHFASRPEITTLSWDEMADG
ncbi:DUF5677 domain-containing protein [Sphaerisporangium sp. NPDC049003]|uniref:DUF5677 domain-containing protein n=1 Tax=Sphaerisporangium sp. NPDC049003 TaxID=3364517 RepID=UPI00371178A0